MQRYIFFDEILNTEDGKRYLATNIPKTIKTEGTFPITHISIEGDRLDLLANKYYGDSMRWWVIARANNLTNGSISIPPGTKLLIPRNI